eukprot:2356974-Amphidinium_carterae.1
MKNSDPHVQNQGVNEANVPKTSRSTQLTWETITQLNQRVVSSTLQLTYFSVYLVSSTLQYRCVLQCFGVPIRTTQTQPKPLSAQKTRTLVTPSGEIGYLLPGPNSLLAEKTVSLRSKSKRDGQRRTRLTNDSK